MIEREIQIRGPSITLGQLLKLSGLAESGAQAKELLRTEQVAVNGEREARRGRKLTPDDVVRVGKFELRLVSDGLDMPTRLSE